MTRRCELTGKLPMSGQIRSHAENKTKRVFRPNRREPNVKFSIILPVFGIWSGMPTKSGSPIGMSSVSTKSSLPMSWTRAKRAGIVRCGST